jgi:hypothetical protein
LRKSPTKDKNELQAHRNHRFPGLTQTDRETTTLATTGNLKITILATTENLRTTTLRTTGNLRTTTLQTTGNLKTSLGVTEGLAVQVSGGMAALIRIYSVRQRARNQHLI